jgi:hypothetical protein
MTQNADEEELDALAETIAKALSESHARRMANRKPVAEELAGVVSVLKEIAAMATNHRYYEEIAAETGRLNQIVSEVELIVDLLEANKPTEQQQKPSPPPPPPPEPNFTDTDRADVLLRTLKLIALDISDYPLLAPLVLTDLQIQFVTAVLACPYEYDCDMSQRQRMVAWKIVEKAATGFPPRRDRG